MTPASCPAWCDHMLDPWTASKVEWDMVWVWQRQALCAGQPSARPVVLCGVSDWLEAGPCSDPLLARLLSTIRFAPFLDWLLLTRTPWRFQERLSVVEWSADPRDEMAVEVAAAWWEDHPPPNVHLGVLVEDGDIEEVLTAALLEIQAASWFLLRVQRGRCLEDQLHLLEPEALVRSAPAA